MILSGSKELSTSSLFLKVVTSQGNNYLTVLKNITVTSAIWSCRFSKMVNINLRCLLHQVDVLIKVFNTVSPITKLGLVECTQNRKVFQTD